MQIGKTEAGIIVALVTAIINLVLFAAGFTTSLTCTLAQTTQTVHAAWVELTDQIN